MADDDFKDKVRSLGFPRKTGKTERKPVINEETGQVGGFHDVRWDGSQDATVVIDPINTKSSTQGE